MALKDFGMFYDLRNMSPEAHMRYSYDYERIMKNENVDGEAAEIPEEERYKTINKLCLEVTSECNLKCTMCFRNSWIDEKMGRMSKETFYKIINDEKAMSTVRTVSFGGMGEPLFHPDIVEMVRACGDKHVELITNATLLTREMSEALIDAGLNKLWVSMDGFKDENYDSIREGAQYKQVLRNIFMFNQARGFSPAVCGLGITFVAMKSNIDQIQNIPDFCAQMNVTDVNISNAIPSSYESAEDSLFLRLLNTGYGANHDVMFPRYRMALMDFTRDDVQDAYAKILEQDSFTEIMGMRVMRKTQHCKFIAGGHVYVRWDGNVTPCMGLLHNSEVYLNHEKITMYHHSFGNVNESALSEIWDSREYSEFRERVMYFGFSPCTTCGGCDMRKNNLEDCYGNEKPTCGVCFWAEGFFSCP